MSGCVSTINFAAMFGKTATPFDLLAKAGQISGPFGLCGGRGGVLTLILLVAEVRPTG